MRVGEILGVLDGGVYRGEGCGNIGCVKGRCEVGGNIGCVRGRGKQG